MLSLTSATNLRELHWIKLFHAISLRGCALLLSIFLYSSGFSPHSFIWLWRVIQFHLDQQPCALQDMLRNPGFSAWFCFVSVTSDTGEQILYTVKFHTFQSTKLILFLFCPTFRQTAVNNISQSFLCKIADPHCPSTTYLLLSIGFICCTLIGVSC